MKKNVLSISELAILSGVTRDTLLHYDKIGLVTPIGRGENNYRRYSIEQIPLVHFIKTFQSTGLPLCDIEEMLHNPSPGNMLRILTLQEERLDESIDEFRLMRKTLDALKKLIEDALIRGDLPDDYTHLLGKLKID
jgi:DNA-binding transcriptional MerR regulator